MRVVTKMADLTKFRQTDVGQSGDFYANYITRDGPNMLTNLMIWATFRQSKLTIFMQIISPDGPDKLANLTILCKLHHELLEWS